MLRILLSFTAAIAAFLPATLLAQSPSGPYGVRAINFPDSYGPLNRTFDGALEVTGGMDLIESSAAFAGISGGRPVQDVNGQSKKLLGWASSGRIVRFRFETRDDSFVADSVSPTTIAATDITFDTTKAPTVPVDGIFLVFLRNGVPITPTIDPFLVDETVAFTGDHPTQAGTKVVYLVLNSAQRGEIFQGSAGKLNFTMNTEMFGSGVGLFELSYAFGAFPVVPMNEINGFEIGFLTKFAGVVGDTNGDNCVDLVDLNNVRNNFGTSGLGDTNGDNTVDLVDLNNVRNNFGTCG